MSRFVIPATRREINDPLYNSCPTFAIPPAHFVIQKSLPHFLIKYEVHF